MATPRRCFLSSPSFILFFFLMMAVAASPASLSIYLLQSAASLGFKSKCRLQMAMEWQQSVCVFRCVRMQWTSKRLKYQPSLASLSEGDYLVITLLLPRPITLLQWCSLNMQTVLRSGGLFISEAALFEFQCPFLTTVSLTVLSLSLSLSHSLSVCTTQPTPPASPDPSFRSPAEELGRYVHQP